MTSSLRPRPTSGYWKRLAALADQDQAPLYLSLLASPMAEADGALRRAGLCGNEARFFDLVRSLQPSMSGSDH